MSLAEADAMLGPGYSSCFQQNDPFADRASLENLARWCQRYTPWVSLETGESPESLLLNITGCAHLWGGEESLAETVQRDLAEYGLRARIAIADHVGSAWALAHFADDPCCVVAAGVASRAVMPLPITALRIPWRIVDLLGQLGIERIEQLDQIDRDSLIARLGEEVITRLDQAMGRQLERLHPLEPAAEIQAEWNLEYPLSHSSAVLEIADQLLQSAIDQLSVGWGVVQFEITLRHEERESSRLPIGLSRPSVEVAHLLGLLKLALDRTKLLAPVTGLLLHVTRTAPLEWVQPTLFETEATTDRGEWDGLIDRLSSRLGRDRVVTSFFVPDAQPERACEYQPALGTKRRHRDEAVSTMRRPIRLFELPRRIQVHVAHPSGMPTAYQAEHGVQSIAHAWGPERIETGWWRGQPIGRDYFQIELADGARLWMFRDLATRQWFLHGAFD